MARSRTAAAPEAVDIPNPALHPDVVKARARHDAIAADLATVRRAREVAEAELGAGPTVPDFEAEGRLIAAGEPTAPVAQLRQYRDREKALAHALGLVAAEVKDVTDRVKREQTAEARATVFLPAARQAVADWLTACRAIEQFRLLVDRIQEAGVGVGTFSPFNQRTPLSLADRSGFEAFARELVNDGFTDPDTVNAVFPGLL